MSSKQPQQQYEEEFDFLVVDDMEQSKKPAEQPLTSSKSSEPTNQRTQAQKQNKKLQIDDKLPSLIEQSRLKSIESEENDKQQKPSTNKINDSLQDEIFKPQDIISIDLSSRGEKQASIDPPQFNNKMLITDAKPLVIEPQEDGIKKNEQKESEIVISGNRQPQRRLMRKPVNQSSSVQPKVEQKQPNSEGPKQQESSAFIEQKSQAKPSQIEVIVRSPINIKFTEEIILPAQKTILKPSEFDQKTNGLSSNLPILTDSLVSNQSQANNNNNFPVISNTLISNADLNYKKSVPMSAQQTFRPLNLISIQDQLLLQTINPAKSQGESFFGAKDNKNSQVQQLTVNKQMTSSITRPLRLNQNKNGEKNEQIQMENLNIDKGAKSIDSKQINTTLPVNQPVQNYVSQNDNTLIGISKISQLKDARPQKEQKEQAIEDVIGLLNLGKKTQHISVPEKQSIGMTNSVTYPINPTISQAQNSSTIIQQPFKSNLTKPTTHINCSVLQLTSLSKQLQKSIFAINQLSHFTNTPQFNCSKLSHSFGHSSVSAVKYYGYSWTEIENVDSNKEPNENITKSKYNRDMLFGSKAKINRQIHQELKESKALTQKKSLYLYVSPNLYPLGKDSLKLNQPKQGEFSFSSKYSFSQRANLAIDLIELLHIVHESDFMISPHSLLPQKAQNAFLFSIQQNEPTSLKSSNFSSKIKFGVHSLQSFKHLTGNSANPFNLKEFIAKFFNIEKIQEQKASKQEPKKISDANKTSSKIQTALKSPQLKFYHEQWFWEMWNKSIKNFREKQAPNGLAINFISPTWLDLFEIPLSCLKIIFGQQIISNLIESKYEQILKNVHKIKPKEKPKPTDTKNFSTKFDPTALAPKPEDQSKQKLQMTSQLLSISVLAPQTQQEILKLCQKPLVSWSEYQTCYKQLIQKNQKVPQTTNKSTPKASNEHSILTNPESKKIFEQISSWICVLPFNEVSQDKYERKRLLSLKELFQRLVKFKTFEKNTQLNIPVLKVKKDQKLSSSVNKQKNSANFQKTDLNKAIISPTQPQKQQSLTVLSSQSNLKSLAQLKQQYFSLLQSNETHSRQEFQSQYIKRPQTHLLTPQLKKKLSAAFLSHPQIMKSPKTFSLIYKASIFNFAAKKFYQYCENKEKLLYVFKVRNQKILYYFNEEKIQRNKQMNGLFGGFAKDNKGTSFIYTGEEVLKVKNSSKAFAVSHIHGPIIGDGDIIIKQVNIENECNYPKSYEQSKKTPKLLKSNRFILDEMDVYEVTF